MILADRITSHDTTTTIIDVLAVHFKQLLRLVIVLHASELRVGSYAALLLLLLFDIGGFGLIIINIIIILRTLNIINIYDLYRGFRSVVDERRLWSRQPFNLLDNDVVVASLFFEMTIWLHPVVICCDIILIFHFYLSVVYCSGLLLVHLRNFLSFVRLSALHPLLFLQTLGVVLVAVLVFVIVEKLFNRAFIFFKNFRRCDQLI